MSDILREQILTALSKVYDPEIRRPVTDLGMIDRVDIDDAGHVEVQALLTVEGCPLQGTLARDIEAAVAGVDGVASANVSLGVMNDEQRAAMRASLGASATINQFADSATRVLAIASGKGGVGKSSLTVNLAVALARQGLAVGLLDADIYGHSVPAMMGVAGEHLTMVDDMIMPIPAYGVATMSIGLMKESRDQVIAWRGPMLDRALSQMLNDVYWGELDWLIVDLPPGTGDMPMSVGRQLPSASVLVVTTPNAAAYEVAERAGTLASRMSQPVIGVVENMSWLDSECPQCRATHRVEVFGSGGGAAVAHALSTRIGQLVPLLAQIPMDIAVRASGDEGEPVVVAAPDSPAAVAIAALAHTLTS